MRGLAPIEDQRGTTLIELVIATAAGMVVFLGLTMTVLAAIHQTTRVSDRVHATQEARLAVHTIVTELHSACVSADVAPVQTGSSGTTLSFVYQTGSGAALTPVLHRISLSGTTLTLTTYKSTTGSTPKWTFSETASSSKTLLTNAAPISGTTPIFTYYKFESGQMGTTPMTVPLSAANAALAVKVNIALKVSPENTPVLDAKGPGIVQDSALLRFTPPAFNANALNLPCE